MSFLFFFDSIIYTDADIDSIPGYYYAVWRIHHKQREIWFDQGDGTYRNFYSMA